MNSLRIIVGISNEYTKTAAWIQCEEYGSVILLFFLCTDYFLLLLP